MTNADQIVAIEPLGSSDAAMARAVGPFSRRIQRLAHDQGLRADAIVAASTQTSTQTVTVNSLASSGRTYHGASNWIARARRQVPRAD